MKYIEEKPIRKIIVAHPGKQHSFQLMYALLVNGFEVDYYTTVYDKPNSFTHFIIGFLKGKEKKKASGRKDERIPNEIVFQFCEIRSLVLLFLRRIPHTSWLQDKLDKNIKKSFGIKIAKVAIQKNVDAVIMYDSNATECFEYLKQYEPNIFRIMDVSAVNRIYMRKVYEKDFLVSPTWADKLRKERAFLWDKKSYNRLKREIALTQHFLVPSKLVKQSIVFSGINENSISLCPYGSNFHTVKDKNFVNDGPLKVIYVGNVTEMKGISYLLEASKKIGKGKIEVTIVGAYNKNDDHFSDYKNYVTFTGQVVHKEVEKLLKKSDVFIFPSLGDSFGLAVLEALACGLPCIVSDNTGAKDVILEGENGFIIKTHSVEDIVNRLIWFYDNRECLKRMSIKAIESAKRYSWSNYTIAVNNAIMNIKR